MKDTAGQGIYQSEDGGIFWSLFSTGMPDYPSSSLVISMMCSPSDLHPS